MEGLTVSNANLTIYIHPSMTNKVRGAILTQLRSLLITYSEDFEGVLLAYQVNVRSKVARILPGLVPHYGVKLKATLLLFAPKPDMLIGDVKGSDIVLEAILEAEVARNAKLFFSQPEIQALKE